MGLKPDADPVVMPFNTLVKAVVTFVAAVEIAEALIEDMALGVVAKFAGLCPAA